MRSWRTSIGEESPHASRTAAEDVRSEAFNRQEANMDKSVLGAALAAIVMSAHAETVNFDRDPVGAAPSGWTCGVTGRGNPRWTVEADPSAPSPPNVLKQSGSGTF